jgi:hypothetical protein
LLTKFLLGFKAKESKFPCNRFSIDTEAPSAAANGAEACEMLPEIFVKAPFFVPEPS